MKGKKMEKNFSPLRGRSRPKVKTPRVGLTRKEFAKDADIEQIIKKYQKTGVLPQGKNPGYYADVSFVPTYQEALETVRSVQDTFMALPSRLRDRFGNDPARYLAFATDPRNAREMVKLGMAVPRESGLGQSPEPQSAELESSSNVKASSADKARSTSSPAKDGG